MTDDNRVTCLCGEPLPWDDLKDGFQSFRPDPDDDFQATTWHCKCRREYDVTAGEFVLMAKSGDETARKATRMEPGYDYPLNLPQNEE
jgi:hypothetical protein